jgi:glyoxylase-like metal-dependent hydrolase (beta-lactamase superfamily II)
MEYSALIVGPIETNCYLIYDKETAIVVDPGDDADLILSELKSLSLEPEYIIYTHGHWDHVGGAEDLKRATNAKIIMGCNELDTLKHANLSGMLGIDTPPAMPDTMVKDGDSIETASGLKVEVIETPGHSPGGISLLIDNHLFCGDTIFFNSVGRTDLPGGDTQLLLNSIKSKIYTLDDNVILLPGHGPSTTVEREKQNNPWTTGS